MTKLEPYRCPRCDYNATNKTCMRNHLYKKRKPCPSTGNDIVLTDSIKEHIMNNRVYKIKDEAKIMNQTINNYNTMNNFIAGLDAIEKINHITAHKIEICAFEDKVQSEFEGCVSRMENDGVRSYDHKLEHTDFMSIVNNLTKVIRGSQRTEFLEELNIIYDAKRKRIKVFSGRWEEYLIAHGITHLVRTIVDYYLETYEIYLMRKLTRGGSSIGDINVYTKCLEEYYHFIGCFDIDPYCKGKYDNQIIFNSEDALFEIGPEDSGEEDGYLIATRFTKMYNDIHGNITNTQRKSKQNEIQDILKSNSKSNLDELDKDIIDLVNIDAGFKENLFDGRKLADV